MNRKAFLRLIRPDGLALTLAGFASMLFGSGLLISIIALFDPEGGIEVGSGLMLLFFLPLTLLLLFLASIVSRRAGPRFALGALVILLAFIEAISLSVAVTQASGQGLAVMCLVSMVLCAPVLFLGGVPVFLALPGLPKEIEAAIFAERCDRAFDFLLRQNQVVSYETLSTHLRAPETEIDRILVALLDSNRIQGERRPEYRLFFPRFALEKILEQIPTIVELRGQISFDDLGRELQVPAELVQEWVTRLMGEERFPGYVHWEEKTLYSEDAQALYEIGRCPKCGGELRLAGKGVIHCTYCGYDIFLKKPAPPEKPQNNERKRSRKSNSAENA